MQQQGAAVSCQFYQSTKAKLTFVKHISPFSKYLAGAVTKVSLTKVKPAERLAKAICKAGLADPHAPNECLS